MKICPFISHMLGEDRADILQIDGPSRKAKTAKSSSGKKDKSDDVVILGYDGGDSAGGVATKPAKKQKTESAVPTHLHCLKDTCRFFQKKDGECQFDSIFDEMEKDRLKEQLEEKFTESEYKIDIPKHEPLPEADHKKAAKIRGDHKTFDELANAISRYQLSE